jgi:DNA-directed RNA polymerase specialized sigma24 family protein
VSTSKKTTPYDFIQRSYREPRTDDPVQRWLPHPEVARAICAALAAHGMRPQDLEDGLQDVYVIALTAFRSGKVQAPADLRAMKAYCATIAKNHARKTLRDAATRCQHFAGSCDPDEHTPLEYGVTSERDPVDARRQLEVLAQLFREGRMPEHGVDILEGMASRCPLGTIAAALGISERAVEGRLKTMRGVYRARMVRLGLVPGAEPLLTTVSLPGAIESIRQAA